MDAHEIVTAAPAARKLVSAYVALGFKIPAARCSSAQARGSAKQYSYWGAVTYEIRARQRDGQPVAVARERASSDRRSRHLAELDTEALAESMDAIMIYSIGTLCDLDAVRAAQWIGRRSRLAVGVQVGQFLGAAWAEIIAACHAEDERRYQASVERLCARRQAAGVDASEDDLTTARAKRLELL
jgi:hypothetical protein